MKRLIKYIVGISVFCIAFALNVNVIQSNYDSIFFKIGTNNCQAGPLFPNYLNCQMGTVTNLGNDGTVTAFWFGDCYVHSIFTTGSGTCRPWKTSNPN